MKRFTSAAALCLAATVLGQTPLTYNLQSQVTPMYDALEGGGPACLAYTGDSIPFRHPWGLGFDEKLKSEWGDGGWAWRGINQDFKWTASNGAVLFKAAFSGAVTKGTSSGKRDPIRGRDTPDGIFTLVNAPDGKITLTIPQGLTVRLHYSTAPGGGTLDVDRSNVAGFDLHIPTDAPVRADASVELPTGYKYTIAGSGQVNAVTMVRSTGFRSARIGRGQNGPADYNTGDTPSTAAVLAEIDPDVLIYMQDWFVPLQSIPSFQQDTRDYVAFVRASVPDVKIVFVAHHAMIDDSAAVSDVLYGLAQELDCGFIDNRQMATYEENLAAGRLAPDGKHLSTAGGKFFAEEDARLMRAAWGR